MAKSPVAVPYNSDGVQIATTDGLAVPVGQSGFIGVGTDGTNLRFFRTNAAGQQVVVGAGVAGVPAGGVLSIQGVAGGTALPVSGTFWQATQPVSAVSLPLPTGAATSALQTTGNTTLSTISGKLPAALVGGRLDTNTGAWLGSTAPTVGQKVMASSLPVVIASDQSEVQVKQGTAVALSGAWPVKQTDGTNVAPTGDAVARSVFQQISDGTTGPVAVKPSSTAATSADKALTVTMSPNSVALPVTFTPAGSVTGVSFGSLSLGGATSGSLQVMRATAYTEPASAAQRSLSSSSANDTSAGTGARTVKLTYYDNTGAGPFTETVTLSGATPVNTVSTTIRFIEKMEVVTAGALGANAGTITLFGSTGGGGGTVGTLGFGNLVTGVGDNSTLWCHHYIAAGLTAQLSVLVVGIQSGGAMTGGQFFARAQRPLVANSAEVLVGDVILVVGAFERSFTFNPKIVGFARVTAYAIPGTNNSTVTCAFDWSESAS